MLDYSIKPDMHKAVILSSLQYSFVLGNSHKEATEQMENEEKHLDKVHTTKKTHHCLINTIINKQYMN